MQVESEVGPSSARLDLQIRAQPDETTCGPTCLEAVYRYYGHRVELEQLIGEVTRLETGGTLGVHLGRHALRSGFAARIVTYNLRMFDPTWAPLDRTELLAKLKAQRAVRSKPRMRQAIDAYIEFLELGGVVLFEELNAALLFRHLSSGTPLLTGLSATYLHRTAREIPESNREDDLRGDPVGHFVVLCGIDLEAATVMVADPLEPNPFVPERVYEVPIDRVVASIFLGVLTYDANLLAIERRS